MWLEGTKGAKPGGPGAASPRASPRKPVIAGAVVPSRYSSIAGFSRFSYVSDPFEATERCRRATLHGERSRPASGDSLGVGGSPRPLFKHCALPPAPKAAGAFQRFRYSVDPFEAEEDHKRAEKRHDAKQMLAGAFVAGGNARDEKRSLKRRMPELRMQLHRALQADWPSYLRVHTDERGVLLAAFAAERLSAERRADLHEYMNRLLSTHPAAAEFGLNRDPSRWGTVQTGEVGSAAGVSVLLYALRPPWVPNELHRLIEPKPLLLTQAPDGG